MKNFCLTDFFKNTPEAKRATNNKNLFYYSKESFVERLLMESIQDREIVEIIRKKAMIYDMPYFVDENVVNSLIDNSKRVSLSEKEIEVFEMFSDGLDKIVKKSQLSGA
jgi:hypothetical protein